jgi:hypothetical protein
VTCPAYPSVSFVTWEHRGWAALAWSISNAPLASQRQSLTPVQDRRSQCLALPSSRLSARRRAHQAGSQRARGLCRREQGSLAGAVHRPAARLVEVRGPDASPTGARYICAAVARRLQMPSFGPRQLRHTTGTLLQEQTGDSVLTAKTLGLASQRSVAVCKDARSGTSLAGTYDPREGRFVARGREAPGVPPHTGPRASRERSRARALRTHALERTAVRGTRQAPAEPPGHPAWGIAPRPRLRVGRAVAPRGR